MNDFARLRAALARLDRLSRRCHRREGLFLAHARVILPALADLAANGDFGDVERWDVAEQPQEKTA